jgi:cell division protein FtsW
MRRTSSFLIAAVLALVSLGIVMLASTSSVKGLADYNDAYYFLKRQLIWLLLSIAVGTFLFRFDYHFWQKLAVPLTVASIILLALVFAPVIGREVHESRRWLRIGPMSLQPSELAKFSVIVMLSSWMTHVGRRARNLKEGLIMPGLVLGVILVLLITEPDFGTTLLVGSVGAIIMFAGGTRLGYLAISSVFGLCAFVLAVMRDPRRMIRILAFLMPDNPKYASAAYHLTQSKVAFIGGGLFGVGLGKSMQKHFYLPEAHNDFILAIIGEELGLIATCLVVLLFLTILVCGMIISFRAVDPFGKLLGFGFTVMITLQAAINIGVVTGCLPTKGLPLPFISYGGSSLMMSMAGVAVVLNIAKHADEKEADDHTRPIKDKAHRL